MPMSKDVFKIAAAAAMGFVPAPPSTGFGAGGGGMEFMKTSPGEEVVDLQYDANGDVVGVITRPIVIKSTLPVLDQVAELITHIQGFAQISGNLNYTGSGGLIAGAGGAIPGPVTGSLTGVPITGAAIMPPTSIQ